MRDRSFLIVVAVLAALFLGAAAVYVYDHNRNDLIADGVKVGGVELGGMRAGAARAKLADALAVRYSQPVVVRANGRRFELTARAAHLSYDVRAMVDAAVARSREGTIFARTWRAVRGETVDADLAARVNYSQAAVTRFTSRVEDRVNRKPRDATLQFSGDGISRVPGRTGVYIDSRSMLRRLRAVLTARLPVQTVNVSEHRVAPKVRLGDLARQYPEVITINRGAFRLHFFRHLQLVKTYTIAVGRAGLETPAGLYHIQDKQVNPSWHVPNSSWAGSLAGQVIPPGPQDPLKARWMGVSAGAGIHGTDAIGSLGTAASHGCIRMSIPDVIELYDKVPVGAPVFIA